ncbi:GTPase-activating protein [Coelomomyces lativittatus]|nr:GTPase-activating protein [Coelomomyces lativittatus]
MLRGDIWLKLARVSTLSLKDKFHQLLEHTSPYEKIIQRDLLRTFPKHPFFRKGGKGVKSLFHLMKVYSLYDIEVGYCQGLAFVAGPILLNIHNEVESFSLFVSLLNNYNLRQLYLPSLDGLHLFIFQLDTLIKNRMPEIHAHFVKEGVKSSMYATEWFMTLFAYRLPLEIEYRVLDLIFSEGGRYYFSFVFSYLFTS